MTDKYAKKREYLQMATAALTAGNDLTRVVRPPITLRFAKR